MHGGWVDGWLDGRWTYGWMDGRDGWVVGGWMDGWVSGWMDVCVRGMGVRACVRACVCARTSMIYWCSALNVPATSNKSWPRNTSSPHRQQSKLWSRSPHRWRCKHSHTLSNPLMRSARSETCAVIYITSRKPPRLHSDETSQVTSLGQATIPGLIAKNPSSGSAM